MSRPMNPPLTGEIWHLSIEDLFAPLPETMRLGGEGPFVINLSTSTAPISLPVKSLIDSEHAHVYQVQRTEDRRLRYRLRLGPFATEDDADAALEKVRDIYPGALTATADTDDLRKIAAQEAKAEAQRSLVNKRSAAAKPPHTAGKPDVQADEPALPASTAVAPAAKLAAPAAKVVTPATKAADVIAYSTSLLSIDDVVPIEPVTRPVVVTAKPVELPSKPTAASAPTLSPAAPAMIIPDPQIVSAVPVVAVVEPAVVVVAPPTVQHKIPVLEHVVVPVLSRPVVPKSIPSLSAIAATPPTNAAVAKVSASQPVMTPPVLAAKQMIPVLTLEAMPVLPQIVAAKLAVVEPPKVTVAPAVIAVAPPKVVVPPPVVVAAPPKVTAAPPVIAVAPPKVVVPRPAVAVAPPNADAPKQTEQLSKRVAELDTTQTVRALTQLELQDSQASRWFVIQLSLGEEAIDPNTVPILDIFSVYRLYSVAGIDQGRIVHALRLGFFAEANAADAVAGYLAAFYDKPTVKRVSSAERERFAEQVLEPRKDVGATGSHAAIEITSERYIREKRTAAAATK